MNILLVDNYDSFTHNLRHLLLAACPAAAVSVVRNDDERMFSASCDMLVVSPGPGTPADTGLLGKLWEKRLVPERMPVFGVCLGLQFLAALCGVPLVRSSEPVHGRTTRVRIVVAEHPLVHAIPRCFAGARYNSLQTLASGYAGSDMVSLALEEGNDSVQIAAHRMLPVCGVQYHPESFMSEHGIQIIRNFVRAYVEASC